MSKKTIIRILQYSLTTLISVALLLYAFKGIKFREIMATFQTADYKWVLVAFVFSILSHLSRAYRWMLLVRPMGYSPSLYHSFISVMAGYFMNFLIPRAGELARCGVIQKMGKVPADTAFGTVVLERIIDVLMLLLMMLILLIVEFNQLSQQLFGFFEDKFQSLSGLIYLAIGGLLAFILCLIIAFYYRKKIMQIAIFQKFKGLLKNILKGLFSIRTLQHKWAFLFHTFLIWFLYYLTGYVLFFCFPETAHLDMWFGYIILIMGSIGMAAPVQGGVGAYHALVGSVFALRGLPTETGYLMAFFMHSIQTLIILIFGGIALIISMLYVHKK
jgi:glycosyltransferase 2 family protein